MAGWGCDHSPSQDAAFADHDSRESRPCWPRPIGRAQTPAVSISLARWKAGRAVQRAI